MPTPQEVQASVERVKRLAEETRGCLDAVQAMLGQNVWTGPSAGRFAEELQANKARLQAGLDGALGCLHRLLNAVNADAASAAGSPPGRS